MTNQTSNPSPEQLSDPEGQQLVKAIHERKELTGTLSNTICNASNYPKRAQPHLLGSDMSHVINKTADSLLAAGYRKPRTITTTEELDALGFQAVILDSYDTPYVCERYATDRTRAEWKPSGMNHLLESDDVLFHGPVTVLHTPEAAK